MIQHVLMVSVVIVINGGHADGVAASRVRTIADLPSRDREELFIKPQAHENSSDAVPAAPHLNIFCPPPVIKFHF